MSLNGGEVKQKQLLSVATETVLVTDIPDGQSTLLPSCKAQYRDAANTEKSLRLLIDSASSANFVKVSILIDLPHTILEKNVLMHLSSLNGLKEFVTDKVCFTLETLDGPIEIQAYTKPYIMTLPEIDCNLNKQFNFDFCEDFPRRGEDVDLLLGITDSMRVLQDTSIQLSENLTALSTVFGYIPCGTLEMSGIQENESQVSSITLYSATDRLSAAVEKLWKMDELPGDNSKDSLTRDELLAVEKIEQLLHFDEKEQKYSTGLLWRDESFLLNNYAGAHKRLKKLLMHLKTRPQEKEAYVRAMQEYIEMGFVRPVTDEKAMDATRTDVNYLPHRGVYDPSRVSTQMRVVFDGSAVTPSGYSLNQCLLPGPPLQTKILPILLRFRKRKIVLIGDISKMFLNILVKEEDRDYLRFLWIDPNDPDMEVKIYQFVCIVFGITDSPCHSISSLKALVKRKLEQEQVSKLEETGSER